MKIAEKPTRDIMQNTKKNIIDVARRLFSEYTYLGVSMSDIAKKLDITKAALYYHFASKLEIYENVLDEVFSNLKSLIAEASREETTDKQIHKLIKNYVDFGLKEKNLIGALALKSFPARSRMQNYISQFRKQVDDAVQPLIRDALENKNLIKNVDYKSLTTLLINMMDGLILDHSFSNKKVEPGKIADKIIAVFSLGA